MRIRNEKDVIPPEFTPDASKSRPRTPAKAKPSVPPKESADNVRVTLSAEARRLAEDAGSSGDETRIARLRELVQSGQLTIDVRAIAQKILNG